MLLLWAAVALSVVFWPVVIWLGFADPIAGAAGTYRTYFQEANWWPFPFLFLGLAPAVWLSWSPMVKTWERLAETGVLRSAGRVPGDREQPEGRPDAATVARVVEAVRRPRGIAIALALLIALVINIVDRAPLYDLYAGNMSLAEQQDEACRHPGPFVKWILEAHRGPGFLCDALPAQRADAASGYSDSEGIAAPAGQVAFAVVTALQQTLIVFFAALAVLHILLHTALFALFERLGVARAQGLRLMLNARSPLNEFGLEHWNHALNNFYWAASPALLGVFVSRMSSPPAEYLPGQVMLGFAVPTCLLAPMIATIIVRQARLPAAWATLEPAGPVPAEDYHRQQLWPFDRNWTSKLGIVLAFALAALSIGFEIDRLIPL